MPELGIVGRDTFTASAVERTDRLEINSLKLPYQPYTYLRNDLCGTGADKPNVESELCTHTR